MLLQHLVHSVGVDAVNLDVKGEKGVDFLSFLFFFMVIQSLQFQE